MVLSAVVIVTAAFAAAVATPSPASTSPPPLSAAQAESLRIKLRDVERRARRPKSASAAEPTRILVTQGEINSYVNFVLQPQLPPGLCNVEFQLGVNRIKARAMVDLDQVKARIDTKSAENGLWLLSGMVSVELVGRLKSEDGFGTFELEDVRLGPVSVPAETLARLVASSTRSRKSPEGFDILAPFRLPYGLQKVRVRSGRVVLEL